MLSKYEQINSPEIIGKTGFLMIQGVIEVNLLGQAKLILEAKCGDIRNNAFKQHLFSQLLFYTPFTYTPFILFLYITKRIN